MILQLAELAWIRWVLAGVGCWKVLQFFSPALRVINVKYFGKKFLPTSVGKWAVITGGSDGIGKSYALNLAARGFSLCLISRNIKKLESVAKEIEEKHGVETMTINVDFTDGPEIYESIEDNLAQISEEIGVLVNNVGMSYKHTEYFHALSTKEIHDLISSNVTACTMMMHMVLPQMVKRQRGVIINVSSLTAIYPMPLLAVYAACKAYVDYLSRAAHYEYGNQGIFIQSLLPGYVATKMSHRKPSLEVPSPEIFISSAIQTIYSESYTYGYLPHKIRGFVHEWLRANMPTSINMAIAMYFMSKARESYFRKLKRRQSEADSVRNKPALDIQS